MSLDLIPQTTPLYDAIPEGIVRNWILERKSLPLRTLPGMEENRWADYHLDDIQSLHKKNGVITLYNSSVPCLIIARRLDWTRNSPACLRFRWNISYSQTILKHCKQNRCCNRCVRSGAPKAFTSLFTNRRPRTSA